MSTEDQAYCIKCKTEKSVSEFTPSRIYRSKKGSLSGWCKKCAAQWQREFCLSQKNKFGGMLKKTCAKCKRPKSNRHFTEDTDGLMCNTCVRNQERIKEVQATERSQFIYQSTAIESDYTLFWSRGQLARYLSNPTSTRTRN